MVDPHWEREFHQRMQRFQNGVEHRGEGLAVSIKVRVNDGCFHRSHSPHAYTLIDEQLEKFAATDDEVPLKFEEHESGPELLVYLAVASAGLTLAKSVIELITEIIKARSAGIKQGDRPSHPLELIVRRDDDRRGFREEIVLRVGHEDRVLKAELEKQLLAKLKKLRGSESELYGPKVDDWREL